MIVIAGIIPLNQFNHIAYIHSTALYSCFISNQLQLFVYVRAKSARYIRKERKRICAVIVVAQISDIIMYHTVMVVIVYRVLAVCLVVNDSRISVSIR